MDTLITIIIMIISAILHILLLAILIYITIAITLVLIAFILNVFKFIKNKKAIKEKQRKMDAKFTKNLATVFKDYTTEQEGKAEEKVKEEEANKTNKKRLAVNSSYMKKTSLYGFEPIKITPKEEPE